MARHCVYEMYKPVLVVIVVVVAIYAAHTKFRACIYLCTYQSNEYYGKEQKLVKNTPKPTVLIQAKRGKVYFHYAQINTNIYACISLIKLYNSGSLPLLSYFTSVFCHGRD